MANHKSALKRVKQNEKRRARNKHVKTRVRGRVKAVREVVAEGGEGDANATLLDAIKEINKAASKGVIPKRRASRKISRLQKLVNQAGA